ncbi:MAG: hypothetical protein GC150_15850 [Rhizobiales bacterium]|nr:hypothetical protein [Hyphomicrobiales bacterium]
MHNANAYSISLLCLSVFVAVAALAHPAMADYRGCVATVIARPAEGESVRWTYEARREIDNRSEANRARREARQLILDCFFSHLNDRQNGGYPNCGSGWAYMTGYPFRDLHQDLTVALCARNRHLASVRAPFLVVLEITGQEACRDRSGGGVDPAEIHRADYRETIRCSEVRQGFNLPRGDYDHFPMAPGAGSPDCSRRCAADARCVAWTFKYAGGSSEPPLCFLKERVSGWREDARFVSGIKNVHAR